MNVINFDKEYPLNNNNYDQNDTQISFLNVGWNISYNDVVDFSTRSVQTTELNKLVKKTTNYLNYISKDKAFKVAGNVEDYTYYNYVRYINKNYSDRYVYAFITRVEYLSKNTTLVYIETDVWQTWMFDLKYKMCFIERSHIAKSDDTLYSNLESEPVGASPSFEKQIDVFNIDWTPKWCVQILSSAPIVNGTDEFEYGGVGENESNYTPIYTHAPTGDNFADAIKGILSEYYKGTDVVDHRQDIIGVKALPSWVVSALPKAQKNTWLINNVVSVDSNADFSTEILPCGYTPKNKKLFSSLYRVLLIYNFNGLSCPLKPELINGDSVQLHCSMKGVVSNTIMLSIANYMAYSQSHFSIPYNASMSVAYNENTGLKQSADAITGILGTIGGIIGTISSFATGNIAGGLSGVSGIVQSGMNTKSAFEEKTASIGQASDPVTVLSTNIRPRLVDCSPTYMECKRIDDFLERFGYAINDFGQLNNWINNRSQWNYIKTSDAKIQLDGNQDDLQKIISMFNNGVTIWHSIDNFGNYNVANN